MRKRRDYVDKNPGYLVGLRQRGTPETHAIADEFVGGWMVITGKFGGISGDRAPVTMSFLSKPTRMILTFHRDVERLRALTSGEMITMSGRITQITAEALHLDDCELLYP